MGIKKLKNSECSNQQPKIDQFFKVTGIKRATVAPEKELTKKKKFNPYLQDPNSTKKKTKKQTRKNQKSFSEDIN